MTSSGRSTTSATAGSAPATNHSRRIVEAIMLADVVDRTDVKMIEGGDRSGFSPESFAGARIGGKRCGQNLDRDRTLQPYVARLVNLTLSRRRRGGQGFHMARHVFRLIRTKAFNVRSHYTRDVMR